MTKTTQIAETVEAIKANLGTMSLGQKKQALEIIHKHNIVQARTDFYTYVKMMAPLFLGTDYIDGRHIQYICETYQSVYEGIIAGHPPRVQVSLPPRSCKTVLTNLFVSWVFGRSPEWKILHLSHTQKLIEDVSGRPIRDLMKTLEYSQIFPSTQIKKDSRSASRWETTNNGVYVCAGVDGKIQGRGANILIGDDMVADHVIRSKTEREKINRAYVPSARSRLWKNGAEIQIGTRGHLNDLLGYLQELDGTLDKPVVGSKRPWKIIKIPAIMDEKWSKILGIPVGHSYWQIVHSLEELLDKKRANSPEDWAAIYMQDPVVSEGNIFKTNMFTEWLHSEPPSNLKFILVSMDTAFSTKNSADYSAYGVWGIFERIEPIKFGLHAGKETKVNHLILLECEKGRWNFPDLCDKLQEIQDAYLPDTFLIENKGSGISLIQELQRRSFPITPYNPTADKITKAHEVTSVLNAKRVWVNKKFKSTLELIQECLAFPNGTHDDQVDQVVMALKWFRESYHLATPHDTEEQDFDDSTYKPSRQSYWSLSAST